MARPSSLDCKKRRSFVEAMASPVELVELDLEELGEHFGRL
jgi:hypothetical protein